MPPGLNVKVFTLYYMEQLWFSHRAMRTRSRWRMRGHLPPRRFLEAFGRRWAFDKSLDGASKPQDWRLQFIGGYLPTLMAGAALALAHRKPNRDAVQSG